MPPRLNLLVIRSSDPEALSLFYEVLGLSFSRHAHGKGPEHFAAEMEGAVFEIYPLTDPATTTTGTRLGFCVDGIDLLVGRVEERGGRVVSAPEDSPWGRRAVIMDPVGHKVELIDAGGPR